VAYGTVRRKQTAMEGYLRGLGFQRNHRKVGLQCRRSRESNLSLKTGFYQSLNTRHDARQTRGPFVGKLRNAGEPTQPEALDPRGGLHPRKGALRTKTPEVRGQEKGGRETAWT